MDKYTEMYKKYSQHPYDKISHTLIIMALMLVANQLGQLWGAWFLANAVLFSREVEQETGHGSAGVRGSVNAFLPWLWRTDSQLDVAIPAAVSAVIVALIYWRIF